MTNINISKGHNKFIVRITRTNDAIAESRAYFSYSTLSECQTVADTLRRDIGRHGDDAIVFTDYPIIKRGQSSTRKVVWE